MASISQLVSAKEKAAVEVGGLSFNIVYRPNKMTMKRMSELTRRAREEDIEALAELIPEILESWDVEGPLHDDDGNELAAEGEVLPVSEEVIGALPAFFALELSGKLQELVSDGVNPTGAKRRSQKR